ncbi:MAG: histidine kinase N-terminal 7TM domain-containing protein, partial [Halobacterium sp.]
GEVIRAAYVLSFGLTAVVCVGSLTQLSAINDADTRRGLLALLLLSAAWASAQAVHLLVPDPAIAAASFTVGLVFGLATVGAWLYFCSAYAGRPYHRNPTYRRASLGVFLAIVAFKLTNPWHRRYFHTETVQTPFEYAAIRHEPAFWVVAGLAYGVSALGFYILLDVFQAQESTSRGAKTVAALAALPVVFDLAGYLSPPPLLGLNYESIGVGLFAVGALFVVREPFFSVSRYGRAQLLDSLDDPVFITDADGRVRDYNAAAATQFPSVRGASRPPLAEVTGATDATADTLELERGGDTRYFVVTDTPVTVGATQIGRAHLFTDVTEIERQRRELQRKDEQLEGFARALTHELRNSIGIISGQVELLSRLAADRGDDEFGERLSAITDETASIESVVQNLQTLARYSTTISETSPVALEDAAETALRQTGVDDLQLVVDDAVEVDADHDRLRELFQNAFEFAAGNGASTVTVTALDDGFAVADDGASVTEFDAEDVFAYGNAVPDQETALAAPNVKMLAANHGWDVSLADSDDGVTRFEVTGVDVVCDERA